jgi:hypothetical protein
LDDLPAVLLPCEVVRVLRLDEHPQRDGTIRKRALGDALRSLDYLTRKGHLRALAGSQGRRYARVEVERHLAGLPVGAAENDEHLPTEQTVPGPNDGAEADSNGSVQ